MFQESLEEANATSSAVFFTLALSHHILAVCLNGFLSNKKVPLLCPW